MSRNQDNTNASVFEQVKSSLQFLLRYTRLLWSWQPLTFRGAAALGLSAAALHFYAIPDSDLVAYMLGGITMGLLLLITAVAYASRIRLAKKLDAKGRFDSLDPRSIIPVHAGILLNNARVTPFFLLTIQRVFDHPGVVSPVHQLTGRNEEEVRQLIDSVRFPHRGLWTLTNLHCTLEDALGFIRFHWSIPFHGSVEVSAPTVSIRPLPVVAASSRSGDQLDQARERSGDLYDTKQYDPSDGVSRILWKTFAKSGELIVRRPEPAIIPEGEVAIFLVARKEDDHVAGAAESYIDQLDVRNIKVLFGTDGMGDSRIGGMPGWLASRQEDILAATNRSVWSEQAGSGRDFIRFLEALEDNHRMVHQVVVFSAEDNTEWFEGAAAAASQRHAKLTVAVVPRSLGVQAELPLESGASPLSLGSRLKNLHPAVFRKAKAKRFDSLLELQLEKYGAELIVCEPAEALLSLAFSERHGNLDTGNVTEVLGG